jgi:hypothetical protein
MPFALARTSTTCCHMGWQSSQLSLVLGCGGHASDRGLFHCFLNHQSLFLLSSPQDMTASLTRSIKRLFSLPIEASLMTSPVPAQYCGRCTANLAQTLHRDGYARSCRWTPRLDLSAEGVRPMEFWVHPSYLRQCSNVSPRCPENSLAEQRSTVRMTTMSRTASKQDQTSRDYSSSSVSGFRRIECPHVDEDFIPSPRTDPLLKQQNPGHTYSASDSVWTDYRCSYNICVVHADVGGWLVHCPCSRPCLRVGQSTSP